MNLPWIESLECVNKQAPLAPELAAQILTQEQKRENELKNNKKLFQYKPTEDPVLNDFKREMMFLRQAQATVMDAIPKLKALGLPTKRFNCDIVMLHNTILFYCRPDDYFAEMAKTDEHMQKIRENLMRKQAQQQQSERVKQLRQQRKEGKALQIQMKLQRQKEKKETLDQVKKFRKGVSKNMDFLDNKRGGISKKAAEKRKLRDKKFGFGGKKRGSKLNTRESAADIGDFKRPSGKKDGKGKKLGKGKQKGNTRPGKNRRAKIKAKSKK